MNHVLTSLSLWGCAIGAEGASALAEALACPDLRSAPFCGRSQENTALTHLNLRTNNISVEGARAVAELLKVSVRWRYPMILPLGGGQCRLQCALPKQSWRVLSPFSCQVNHTLTSLVLNNNYIGTEGAQALAEGLRVSAVLAGKRSSDGFVDVHVHARPIPVCFIGAGRATPS